MECRMQQETVRVRATLRLRNDELMAARERVGLTQSEAAAACGVSTARYGQFERFAFAHALPASLRMWAERIAGAMDLDVDVVLPPGMVGTSVQSTYTHTFDMPPSRLIEGGTNVSQYSTRMALPSDTRAAAEEASGLGDALRESMGSLTPQERSVLRLRRGLDDYPSYTLDDVGRIMKISRERVRQIEDKAVRKLQHPAHAEKLARFLTCSSSQ